MTMMVMVMTTMLMMLMMMLIDVSAQYNLVRFGVTEGAGVNLCAAQSVGGGKPELGQLVRKPSAGSENSKSSAVSCLPACLSAYACLKVAVPLILSPQIARTRLLVDVVNSIIVEPSPNSLQPCLALPCLATGAVCCFSPVHVLGSKNAASAGCSGP